jgi:hypothetical protein
MILTFLSHVPTFARQIRPGIDFDSRNFYTQKPRLVLLLNTSVVSAKFGVNLVGHSTEEVTGSICPAAPDPLTVLDNLKGVAAILPLFGQLDQPILNVCGEPELVFDEDLLPDLLDLLGVISLARWRSRSRSGRWAVLEFLHFVEC